MSEPARFLTALSQALASTGLYGPAHPATIRAVDGAHQRLLLMQAAQPAAAFTFLRDEILCGPEVVEELHGWDWNRRLADAGVERLEFTGPVGAEEFARFIDQIAARLGLRPGDPPEVWQMGSSAIRFGQVAVRGSSPRPAGPRRAWSGRHGRPWSTSRTSVRRWTGSTGRWAPAAACPSPRSTRWSARSRW